VAFIYKGASAVASPVSPLVRAPFDRQRDVLKLARMGNSDCKRLWNSFADEAPALARLVVADVENERQEDAAATEKVDKRLRQAEKLAVKGRKPKVTKSRGQASPGFRAALMAADEVLRLAEQESRSPELRVWAEMAARE
jgi:hypothetical protein